MCLFLTLIFQLSTTFMHSVKQHAWDKVFQNVLFEVVLFQLHSYPLVITVGEALKNPYSPCGCCPLLSVLYVMCIAYAVNFCFCFCYKGGCCIDCDWKGSIHKWSGFGECKSLLTHTIIKSRSRSMKKTVFKFHYYSLLLSLLRLM